MTTAINYSGVSVFFGESVEEAGESASREIRQQLIEAIESRGGARIIFASAPSQEWMLRHLFASSGIDWSKVEAFHMDEYVGLPFGHRQSFAQWLADRFNGVVMKQFHAMTPGNGELAEIERYSSLLTSEPIDVACLGIGVNGHLAFNEPFDAAFDDPSTMRAITLDETSRRQQVDDGCFATLDEVPRRALTLTIPALLSAKRLVTTVTGEQKAAAVSAALLGEITEGCPASALRTHSAASLHLDQAAATGLQERLG